MDKFITDIEDRLRATAPELMPLFAVMSKEAQFGHAWIARDLAALPRGARVLEVGGGIFLLSCQMAREGFDVTTVDPLGQGFSEFGQLQDIVIGVARAQGFAPQVASVPIEEYVADAPFDLACSVNVMEHVDDPLAAMERVTAALKPGASYRFICPNYLFPYEPHFNIPTLFSKKLTEKIFRRRIENHPSMEDPKGVWRSLNWIGVRKVRRYAAQRPLLSLTFRRDTLVKLLERALSDPAFAARRSPWMVRAIGGIVRLKIHRLAGFLPPALQPVMDCTLTRTA